MISRALRDAPRPLILGCAFFFAAAYFAAHFPDAPGRVAGSYASNALIAAPPAVALWRYLGARRAVFALLAVSLFAYAVESAGVATGFPYGSFHYSDSLGPRLGGLAPYTLPVSYLPLVIGAVAATGGSSLPARALVSAALLVLVDGVLDPGAVALGFWVWLEGGIYYGVPASNFLGWLLSGTVASALLLATGRPAWGKSPPPPGLLDGLILALAFWSGAAVFSGLVVPALLGSALLVFLLHRRSRLSRTSSFC